jgi:hypothetical protein
MDNNNQILQFCPLLISVLNKEGNIENDIAKFINESVYDKLSTNIREYFRITRLAGNDVSSRTSHRCIY